MVFLEQEQEAKNYERRNNMPDQVMKPKQKGNTPGIVKQVNRGSIQGPTGSAATLTAFNRSGKKK